MAENSGMKGKILTFVGIAFLVIVIAAGTSLGLLWYMSQDSAPEEAKTMGPTYQIGDFTVNLSGSGGYQYLQTNIVVEVSDEEVINELDSRSPQVQDAILTTLRSQSLEQIQEPGANHIKQELTQNINGVIQQGEIKNVWFTQFVVQ